MALEDKLLQIRKYLLEERDLELHPKKISIRKISYGVDFVGQVLRPYYRTLRLKTKKRIFRFMSERINLYRNGYIAVDELRQMLESYKGLLKHGDNYIAQRRLRELVWRQMVGKFKAMKLEESK